MPARKKTGKDAGKNVGTDSGKNVGTDSGKRPTITAVMAVYNDADVLPRCIKSFKGAVDEIVIALDGKSPDDTAKVARRYTAKVFVRPHISHGEPHRPFLFKKATGDWILWIDADEIVTPAMRDNLHRLARSDRYDCYGFLWDTSHNRKNIKRGYFAKFHKFIFFRKSALKPFYGMPNEMPRVNGKTQKTSYHLIHDQKGERNTMRYFFAKTIPIVKLHSRIYVDGGLAKHPSLFYLLKAPVWFCAYIGYNIMKGGLGSGIPGLSITVQQALYNFLLFWYVFQYKAFPKTKLPGPTMKQLEAPYPKPRPGDA